MLCEDCVAIGELDFIDYIAARKSELVSSGVYVFVRIPYDALGKFQKEFSAEMLKKENAQLSTRYQSLYVVPLRDREVADRYRYYSHCCDGWGIFKVDHEYIMRNLQSRYSTNYDPQVIFGALDKAYRSIVDQLG